jgi:TolB protein
MLPLQNWAADYTPKQNKQPRILAASRKTLVRELTIRLHHRTFPRLTTANCLDDGPEHSPDGKYIYFNSERTGHMQIWCMHADGSAQEQITFDAPNPWFPHISPDGKWMVFLSYGADVTGHPPNKDVQLRLIPWSPDSLKVAFVSYQLLPAEESENK